MTRLRLQVRRRAAGELLFGAGRFGDRVLKFELNSDPMARTLLANLPVVAPAGLTGPLTVCYGGSVFWGSSRRQGGFTKS